MVWLEETYNAADIVSLFKNKKIKNKKAALLLGNFFVFFSGILDLVTRGDNTGRDTTTQIENDTNFAGSSCEK